MDKKGFFSVFFVLTTIFSFGQLLQNEYIPNSCGTMAADSIRRVQHPELGTLDQFEEWFQQKIEETKEKNQFAKKQTIYTLPVIFHVMHDGDTVGGGENISDAQIQSQIDVLNLNYRKQNPDTIKLYTTGITNYGASNWKTLAADCEINFCLAKADTNGNELSSPGIERINVNSLGISSASPYTITYVIDNIKPVTIWNPNKYLNIWVVNGSMTFDDGTGDILGFATFPVSSTLPGVVSNIGTLTTDGVVLAHNVVGTVGTLHPLYRRGKTAVHEIGHWLGLRHTWGDEDCGNDYCSDTPVQKEASNTCAYPDPSCGNNGDMVANFMNYTPDVCAIMFTHEQKIRMQTTMANCPFRVSLATQSCEIPEKPLPTSSYAFPNPSVGKIMVSGTVPISTIRMYNILGDLILEADGKSSTSITLDLTGYSSGIYFIKTESGTTSAVQKIMLNAQ